MAELDESIEFMAAPEDKIGFLSNINSVLVTKLVVLWEKRIPFNQGRAKEHQC